MISSHRRPAVVGSIIVALLCAATAVLTQPPPAQAFKPYTHVYTAWSAYGDVVEDGRITLGGRQYPVDGRVVSALQRWPAYYQGGVIGPDGFPDLTFGQSVIHSRRTGEWLRHLLAEAWRAQASKAYTAAEKGQILAFTYGFLTHAAGDMWAHTLVNDFSRGIFPAAEDLVGRPARIGVALRHIIVEGYIGDATPGFDGNPDRTPVGSDVSDDSTTQLALAAPHTFLYNTLVDPRRDLPVGSERGPLIDHFLDLQADLEVEEALLRRDERHTECALFDPDCVVRTVSIRVPTVRGAREVTLRERRCEARYFCVASTADRISDRTTTAWMLEYHRAWVDDIARGLRHWSELGLAISRGLFDPQARRDLQNHECADRGPESSAARARCEDAISVQAVVMHQIDPFLLEHLLPMMGLPDASKTVIRALRAIAEVLDAVVGKAMNPLRLAEAELREAARKFINGEIKRVFGVDLAMLGSLLDHPSYWMNVDKVAVDTPAGTLSIPLFAPGTRDRLDRLMGLTPDDHRAESITLPDGQVVTASVLRDEAVARDFAIMDNTVTTAKLALLEGTQLNQVATDVLQGRGVMKPTARVTTYPYSGGVPRNVMTSALVDGVADADATWLLSADGDHNWRYDGSPTFPVDTDDEVHGGFGTFPLWESCTLRPVFQELFTDWEHGPLNFPADRDAIAYDATDPKAPTIKPRIASPHVLKLDPIRPGRGGLFVGSGPGVLATVADAVYADSALGVLWELHRGTQERPVGEVVTGSSLGGVVPVPLDGPDGVYTLSFQATDPCHRGPFAGRKNQKFRLDQSGPAVTVTRPAAGRLVDSDDTVSVEWEADDGVGVGADLRDGRALLGVSEASHGERLDLFLQPPGLLTIDVLQPDELDNLGWGETQVDLHATSASLRSNLERARDEQLILDEDLYLRLAGHLDAAVAAHEGGDHALEREYLDNVAAALRGEPRGIDSTLREVLVALVDDLISIH